jgi:hypothetical protein
MITVTLSWENPPTSSQKAILPKKASTQLYDALELITEIGSWKVYRKQ